MKKLLVLFFVIPLFLTQSKAQKSNMPTTNFTEFKAYTFINDSISDSLNVIDMNVWDHLTIISDSRLDTLLSIYQQENKRRGGIDGYRVQLYTGNKAEADKVRARFISKYPNVEVHLKFPSPEFYVRVGDFRTKSEAIKLKYLIEKDFPDSFIVEDIIDFPELESQVQTEKQGK